MKSFFNPINVAIFVIFTIIGWSIHPLINQNSNQVHPSIEVIP